MNAHELRHHYQRAPWARRSCAVPGCSAAAVQLHHATYRLTGTAELFALVPFCAPHHYAFEYAVWPAMRSTLTRSLATLFYVVHGQAPRDLGRSPPLDQLALDV